MCILVQIRYECGFQVPKGSNMSMLYPVTKYVNLEHSFFCDIVMETVFSVLKSFASLHIRSVFVQQVNQYLDDQRYFSFSYK